MIWLEVVFSTDKFRLFNKPFSTEFFRYLLKAMDDLISKFKKLYIYIYIYIYIYMAGEHFFNVHGV